MADEAVVRISRDKPTELEFQVVVKGTEDISAKTAVRFVIAKVDGTHDMIFHATHVDGDTWRVDIPVLERLTDGSYDVRIEVIIDNYYFEPAQGKVTLLSDPRISMTSTVKAKVKPKAKKEKVEERAPGTGTAFGGMEAPTTNNLRPEFPPVTKHVEKEDDEDDDKKKKKLPFIVKPGEGVPEAQDDGKDDVEEFDELREGFNPQRVAEQIIMKTLGLNKQQRRAIANKPGYLFKRGADGKPVIAALSDPKVQRDLREREGAIKEEKVKALLRELAN